MINYEPGRFSVYFIFTCRGSVIPKALLWALPAAALAYTVGRMHREIGYDFELIPTDSNMRTLWASFQYMLGFLCVFRTQQAYGRYIEGALLLRQMRTEWVNAICSIVSFSSRDESKRASVERFHHYVVRLMSLLSCYTLQSMSDAISEDMPVISFPGLEVGGVFHLRSKATYHQRSEVVKQWIQRIVVEEAQKGNIIVQPPILASFFQALDRGAMYASQARNLTDVPFPFPYAQVMTVMLLVHALFTALIAGLTMYSEVWGAAFTFISVLAFWGVNYIAAEIESPFGDDENDLPLINIQQDMMASFWIQLEHQTQKVPDFIFDKQVHRRWAVQMINEPVSDAPEHTHSALSMQSFASKMSKSASNQSQKIGSPVKKSIFDSSSPVNHLAPRHSKLAGGSSEDLTTSFRPGTDKLSFGCTPSCTSYPDRMFQMEDLYQPPSSLDLECSVESMLGSACATDCIQDKSLSNDSLPAGRNSNNRNQSRLRCTQEIPVEKPWNLPITPGSGPIRSSSPRGVSNTSSTTPRSNFIETPPATPHGTS